MIQAARCTVVPLGTIMSFLERNLRETMVPLVNDSNYSPKKSMAERVGFESAQKRKINNMQGHGLHEKHW
jgi:hypothetical protein